MSRIAKKQAPTQTYKQLRDYLTSQLYFSKAEALQLLNVRALAFAAVIAGCERLSLCRRAWMSCQISGEGDLWTLAISATLAVWDLL